jgi:hypothetical protein
MTTAVAIDEPAAPPQPARDAPRGGVRGEMGEEQPLAALPSAVAAACRFVRYTLTEWQIDTDRTGRVEDAVRELVTHSVDTTGVDSAAPLYRDDYNRLQLIVVRLRLASDLLVAEVWDRTESPPQPRLGEHAAVLAMGDYDYAMPRPGRRVVWCSTHTGSLPRRVPRPVRPPLAAAPDLPPEGVADLPPLGGRSGESTGDLLRRVLDGLHQLPSDPP